MTVLDVDYVTEKDKPIIRLFKKDPDSNNTYVDTDKDFDPYFYALPENKIIEAYDAIKELDEDRISEIRKVEKSFLGEPIQVVKITAVHPKNVPDLRKKVKELEAVEDVYECRIPFKRRYIIDKDVTPLKDEIDLKKLAFDIETFNDNILMASFANEEYEKVISTKEINEDYVEVVKNEKEVLQKIEEIINQEDPDIIITYNGDNFDFPKVNERSEELKQKMNIGRDESQPNVSYRGRNRQAKIKGRIHTDLYPIVRRNLDLPSYTLENVYENVLREEKPDLEWKEMEKIWGNEEQIELKKLAKYSLSDAKATYEISEEFFPLQKEMTRLIGQLTDEISRSSTGKHVEWLLLKKAYKTNELAPNKPQDNEYVERRRHSFIGGYVKEPEQGLHENIIYLDFKSLYPSIIVEHNICPTTLEETNDEPPHEFSQEEEGFIPGILKELIKQRTQIKKQMKQTNDNKQEYKRLNYRQRALKLLSNSFFGYLGYPAARWYSRESAESVTAYGRNYIDETIKDIEKEGFNVVYADTDGFYAVLPDKSKQETKEKAEEFLDYINNELPGMLKLEYEGFYKRGLFVTKKKYAVIDEDDYITTKGLEIERRDWSIISKETQKNVLKALLRDGSVEKALDIVRETVDKLKNYEIPEKKLVIMKQLTKSPDKYKSKGPQVQIAERMQRRGEDVKPGTVISYIVTEGTGNVGDRSKTMKKYEESTKNYDSDYYIDKQVVPAVSRILKTFGYQEEDLKHKQEGLDEWM